MYSEHSLQWVARYSGILNSGVPDIAVPKSLGTNASRYSGIPPLYWTLQTGVAKPPRLLQTRANTQTHATTSSYIMPCAARELCNLADVELIAPNGRECGHECRGGCGGRLHGMCGEVEDTDSDNPNNRICHTCISKRSLSNPAKRKQGQDFLQPGTSKKHKPGASGAGKELNDAGEVESAGGESVLAPPPYSDLSEFFGPLEYVAQSAGNSEAG